MMRMMVGLMGKAAFISISSSVMPMMDSSTMARSSWFHLGVAGGLSAPGTPHAGPPRGRRAAALTHPTPRVLRAPRPPRAPVPEEPPEPKSHQLQRSLEDEDDGEHVVTVLERLVQRLRADHQAAGAARSARPASLLHAAPCQACKERPGEVVKALL